jgi:hypothetical protein
MRRDARAERDDLRAQLAAAQAQLAEARHEHDRVGEWINHYKAEQEAIIARYMARLEAVRAQIPVILAPIEVLRHGIHCTMRQAIFDGARCSCKLQSMIRDEVETALVAALSAAPQPEPEVDPCVTFERDPKNVQHYVGHLVPEPPASDEPARCEHGRESGHWLNAGSAVGSPPWCPGPSARPTPECRHCNGSGIAHTFDGEDVGICGTCHGTGSAAGGGL